MTTMINEAYNDKIKTQNGKIINPNDTMMKHEMKKKETAEEKMKKLEEGKIKREKMRKEIEDRKKERENSKLDMKKAIKMNNIKNKELKTKTHKRNDSLLSNISEEVSSNMNLNKMPMIEKEALENKVIISNEKKNLIINNKVMKEMEMDDKNMEKILDDKIIMQNLNENMNQNMKNVNEVMEENLSSMAEMEIKAATNRVMELTGKQDNLDDMLSSSNRILEEINKKVMLDIYEQMDSNLLSWQMVMDYLRMEKEGLFMDSKIKMMNEFLFMDKDEEFEEYIMKSEKNRDTPEKMRCRDRFHEKEHICSYCRSAKEKKGITFLNMMLANSNVRKWSIENNCQISMNLNLLKVKAEEYNLDNHRKKLVVYSKVENIKLMELEMSMKKKKNFKEELPTSYFDFSMGSKTSVYSVILEKSIKVSLSSKYLVTAMRSMFQDKPIFFDMSCVEAHEVREKDRNCFYRMMNDIIEDFESIDSMNKMKDISCMNDLPLEIEMLLLSELKRKNLYISIKKENSLLNHISSRDFSGAHKIKGYLLSTLELRSIKFYKSDITNNTYGERNWSMRLSDESLDRTMLPFKNNCFYNVVRALIPEIIHSNRIEIFKNMHSFRDIPCDLMYQLSNRTENIKIYIKYFSVDDYKNHISLLPFDKCTEMSFLRLMDEDMYSIRFYQDSENQKNKIKELEKNSIKEMDIMLCDLKTYESKSKAFQKSFYNYFKYNNMDQDSILNVLKRLTMFYKHLWVSLEDFKTWVKLNDSVDEADIMMMENNILFLMYDIMQVVEISNNNINIQDTMFNAEEVIKIKRRRSYSLEENNKLYRLHDFFNRRIGNMGNLSEWNDMILEFIINQEEALKFGKSKEDTTEIKNMKMERSNSNYNTASGKEFEHNNEDDDWVKL